MGEIIIKSKTIAVPNIRYNTYECFRKTGFWASDKTYIRAKDRNNECSKELVEFKDIHWNIINKELDLIFWFYSIGINRDDFEFMRSKSLLGMEQQFLGTKIDDINTLPNSYVGEVIKKHWALELWKWYNNNYHLTGIGSFRTMGDGGGEIWVGQERLSYGPQTYHWEWPEKYGLIR